MEDEEGHLIGMSNGNSGLLFDGRYLRSLIIPLVAETLLGVTIGMADTIMVSSAGEAAVSGVSLVDSIGSLYVFLVTAFATGGAVVCSQYLGRKDYGNASSAARQLVMLSFFVFLALGILMLAFRDVIVGMLFGTVDDNVLESANDYFVPIMVSLPLLSLSSSATAILRTMGKTRISLLASILSNAVNVAGNAVFIYGFSMGSFGAGLASLIGRATGAILLMAVVTRGMHEVSVAGLFSTKPDRRMIWRIVRIALPSGIENSIFHIGKILMTSTISRIGTGAIAAYAVSTNLGNFSNLGAQAIGLASITVIGQCCGAGRYDQAEYYSRKLLLAAYVLTAFSCAVLSAAISPLVGLYNLSPEGRNLAIEVSLLLFVQTAIFWPMAFTLPNFLRAAGDVKFTMIVSIASMWIFRVTLAEILGVALGFGLAGVYWAMFVDWYCRIVFFAIRFRKGKWKSMPVI